MCGIDNRACMGRMGRQPGHDSAHGGMAVDQIEWYLLHKAVELAVDRDIGRMKRTPDKVDLMTDDTGSVKTVIVIAIGRRVIIGCIMYFIAHGLQDPYIIHLKLGDESAYCSYQKCFLFHIGKSFSFEIM